MILSLSLTQGRATLALAYSRWLQTGANRWAADGMADEENCRAPTSGLDSCGSNLKQKHFNNSNVHLNIQRTLESQWSIMAASLYNAGIVAPASWPAVMRVSLPASILEALQNLVSWL
jgi:hypothetical protein